MYNGIGQWDGTLLRKVVIIIWKYISKEEHGWNLVIIRTLYGKWLMLNDFHLKEQKVLEIKWNGIIKCSNYMKL